MVAEQECDVVGRSLGLVNGEGVAVVEVTGGEVAGGQLDPSVRRLDDQRVVGRSADHGDVAVADAEASIVAEADDRVAFPEVEPRVLDLCDRRTELASIEQRGSRSPVELGGPVSGEAEHDGVMPTGARRTPVVDHPVEQPVGVGVGGETPHPVEAGDGLCGLT